MIVLHDPLKNPFIVDESLIIKASIFENIESKSSADRYYTKITCKGPGGYFYMDAKETPGEILSIINQNK